MKNKKSILSIRIKELRNDLNLTQEDLAKKLGLNNKSSIANYESGYSIPSDEIKLKMCKVFGCTMDYLMGKSEYKNYEDYKRMDEYILNYAIHQSKEDASLIANTLNYINTHKDKSPNEIIKSAIKDLPLDRQSVLLGIISHLHYRYHGKIPDKNAEIYHSNILSNDKRNSFSNNFYMCPVYGQISAGQPNWAEENIEGRLPIDTELMDIINPEEYFFLRVNGESMNKVIKNGAFALIHKQDMVEDGEIAVVLVNGYDATLKRFTKKGDVVVLEPDSTDSSFRTQIYDKTTPIKILGKYVGKMEINK